ncbi:calcium-binding protein [Halocynthiibacter styelae]|uniref:Calcium-binding protein n=1 Tax=Halocynthiibacter styelae TaxID=2761955 RepID=A0A8J7LQR4_9RHOB|nr:calcium-binding protein [Paenihalocynthiibacter styelae]MBI1495461.1 hypothetical protein [Paenihalocynthiibacter styelae]
MTILNTFYLGNLAIIDPVENGATGANENIFGVLGTYGTVASPLYNSQAQVEVLGSGISQLTTDHNPIASGSSSISYDTGAGPIANTADGIASYQGSITYSDGSATLGLTLQLIQTIDGDTFLLVPESQQSHFNKPVETINLDAAVITPVMHTLPLAAYDDTLLASAIPDGVVDGENTDDTMGPGYNDSGQAINGGGDIIDGPDGLNDVINGNGGNDTIHAGLGADIVDGGKGDDLIDGGFGLDTLNGGEGNDTVSFQQSFGSSSEFVNVDLLNNVAALNGGVSGTETVIGFENVIGSQGNDQISGTDESNILEGRTGDDLINGRGGDDTILGGAGNDTIAGGAGSDTISGGDNNDIIYGDELPESGVGVNAGLIDIGYMDVRSGSATQSGVNQAVAGDTVIFDNIGVTEDGRVIYGKLELVEKSDPNLTVDLVGNQFLDIRLNGINNPSVAGETATFKLSFFDTATDQPISLNGHSVFTDVDQTPNGTEVLTLPDDSFSAFGVTDSNTLNISSSNGSTVISGTTNSVPTDQNAWLTAYFENQDSITFTAAARGATTGYSFGPGELDDEVVTPIVSSDDVIDGGDGDDVVYGMVGDDRITGGAGDDTLNGGEGDDIFVEVAGDGADTIEDFGTGNSGSIDDGDQANNDFVDLSAFYNATTLASVNGSDSDTANDFTHELAMLRADAADGQVDGIINGTDYSAEIGGVDLTLLNAGVAVTGSALTSDNTNVMCFADGTLVLSRFSSGLFRAIFAMKETRHGTKIQRRVQT